MENYLGELIARDLLRLKDELVKFNAEENIWGTIDGVTNPAGTLVLHLLGNFNYTIGALIGGTGYVRQRDLEFSSRDIPREKLIADIEATVEVVKNSLRGIEPSKLEETYPLEMAGKNTTAFYLTFFYGHLNYHLGQVNYLRRILEA
jgi:hypothetical protein